MAARFNRRQNRSPRDYPINLSRFSNARPRWHGQLAGQLIKSCHDRFCGFCLAVYGFRARPRCSRITIREVESARTAYTFDRSAILQFPFPSSRKLSRRLDAIHRRDSRTKFTVLLSTGCTVFRKNTLDVRNISDGVETRRFQRSRYGTRVS